MKKMDRNKQKNRKNGFFNKETNKEINGNPQYEIKPFISDSQISKSRIRVVRKYNTNANVVTYYKATPYPSIEK